MITPSLKVGNPKKWQLCVDTGGTFTDIIARAPSGRVKQHKLLSRDPERYEDPVTVGIRAVMTVPDSEPIPLEDIEYVAIGTTLATNTLLERSGPPTLLCITRGFRDLLAISYQNRPAIFALDTQNKAPLYGAVIEIDERLMANGTVETKLNEGQSRADLLKYWKLGYRSCAVALLHGYKYSQHEARLGAIAGEIGYTQISLSHKVHPEVRYVMRADTTVIDAYVAPVIDMYKKRLLEHLGKVPIYFMKSDGGLATPERFHGIDAIYSGPAGGAIANARLASEAHTAQVIGFDMGGTSTDVTYYGGRIEYDRLSMIDRHYVQTPVVQLDTVAAGGGSILTYAAGRYRVGPASAGADPGPACYRRGGPLTVTDCNVLLGRLQGDWLPKAFGPKRDSLIDAMIVRSKFEQLAAKVSREFGKSVMPENVAWDCLSVAVHNMANAIKKITVAKGRDVADYTLNCFGGAGGQHACLVADALGMKRIMVHPYSSVFAAYGIGNAGVTEYMEIPVEGRLDRAIIPVLQAQLRHAVEEASSQLRRSYGPAAQLRSEAEVLLRYSASTVELRVPFGAVGDMVETFVAEHQRRFGFLLDGEVIVVTQLAVRVTAARPSAAIVSNRTGDEQVTVRNRPEPTTTLYSMGERVEATVWREDEIANDQSIKGPAVIVCSHTTLIVEQGWRCVRDTVGVFNLTKTGHERVTTPNNDKPEVDPLRLELFNNIFMNIAEQMGVVLQNTAYSTNVKERLDFSCAVFDSVGNLLSNAPHIPVHLGSMGDSVKTVIDRFHDEMRQGDVFMMNDPYHGGTHLPDITVVEAVVDRGIGERLFYVASRAHHSDIGGITPGSMPPFSKTIEEEGILIEPVQIVQNGHFLRDVVEEILNDGKWPVRNMRNNIADLSAQIAANRLGCSELLNVIERYGVAVVRAYTNYIRENAEEEVRRALRELGSGEYKLTLDDGEIIAVRVEIDQEKGQATVDFEGTSGRSNTNFNTPSAVTKATVLYVVRTLVKKAIPLNDGCLVPIQIKIPRNSLLDPRYPDAIVAGNVETSQLLANAMYLALGELACSQATSNNVTYGNEKYQYYETIGGGAGAGDGFNGASGIHTHMTNSLITDPEVLEQRYPIEIRRFEIREGSGGDGRWKGGDGLRRETRFLEKMELGILSSMREVAPPGLGGGRSGAVGRQWVVRANGEKQVLGGVDKTTVYPGDAFVVETPGGGGYGRNTNE